MWILKQMFWGESDVSLRGRERIFRFEWLDFWSVTSNSTLRSDPSLNKTTGSFPVWSMGISWHLTQLSKSSPLELFHSPSACEPTLKSEFAHHQWPRRVSSVDQRALSDLKGAEKEWVGVRCRVPTIFWLTNLHWYDGCSLYLSKVGHSLSCEKLSLEKYVALYIACVVFLVLFLGLGSAISSEQIKSNQKSRE